MEFDASSVKYIIVKNVDEMIHLFDAVDDMDDKYSSVHHKLLKTKIISTKQILEDFNEFKHITNN